MFQCRYFKNLRRVRSSSPSLCLESTLHLKPTCLCFKSNRPADGHTHDGPRDAALRKHHGQIHHPAPLAQLSHRPVQQAAAHGEHAGVR